MTADEYIVPNRIAHVTDRLFANLNSGNHATNGIVQLTGDIALSVFKFQ